MKKLIYIAAITICATAGCTSGTGNEEVPTKDSVKTEAPLNGRQVIPVRGGGQMEGLMRDGKRHGPWVSRFPNGTIRSRTNYVNGVEEGPVEVFFGNNVTYYKGRHHKGKPSGEWVFNDTLGNEIKRVMYDSTGKAIRP